MKTALIHITPINLIGDAIARAYGIVQIRHTSNHGSQGPSGTMYVTSSELDEQIKLLKERLTRIEGCENVAMIDHRMSRIQKAAIKFSEMINRWLTEEELKTVIERNKENKNSGTCCATHDFCDANEAMIEALDQFCQLTDEEHINIWNGAWDLAKGHNFNVKLLSENII